MELGSKDVAIRSVSSDWDLAIEQQKRLINVLTQALRGEDSGVRQEHERKLGQRLKLIMKLTLIFNIGID